MKWIKQVHYQNFSEAKGRKPSAVDGKCSWLFHQGFAPYILTSGWSTPNVKTTEWEFLRRIRIKQGVPDSAILREDKVTNTFENSRFSKHLLHQMEIKSDKETLVCKSYHARRALLTYQIHFNETAFLVKSVTDKTGITKDNWFLDDKKITPVMKELTKVGQNFGPHIPNWVRPLSYRETLATKEKF
ncbi:YdcF family protein [Paenibacillus illinoisensis]|uniref:YdcF family protein n=1 Tax=Paenibacillus illinoisensis TaxID=59845 RepID=A0ABW8HWI2_9BACL